MRSWCRPPRALACCCVRDGLLRPRAAFGALAHPVIVFSLLFAVVALARGGLAYEAYAWDELSSWTGFAKQMVVFDDYLDPGMSVTHRAYLPGWRFLLAFPGLLSGAFDESEAAVFAFALHVGLLGTVFDVVTHLPRQSGGSDRERCRLIGWLVVLVMLALETTWLLVPLNLLVERPQIYVLCACFAISIAALRADADHGRLMAHLGLLFAFGYLVKTPMVLLAPSVLLIVLAMTAREISTGGGAGGRALRRRAFARRGVLRAAQAFGPFLAIFATWSMVKPRGSCANNILSYLSPDGLARLNADNVPQLAAGYGDAALAYLTGYKLPLTALAAVGLATALRTGYGRIVVAAVALYVVLYTGSLFSAYVICPDSFNYFLSSFPRYFRVMLRVVQFCGVLLLFLQLLEFRPLRSLGRKPVPLGLMTVLLLGLMAFQARAVHRSLVDMVVHSSVGPELRGIVMRTVSELRLLKATLAGERMERPKVIMLFEHSNNYPYILADYLITANRRGAALKLFSLAFRRISSQADNGADGGFPARVRAIRERIAAADVIWPLHTSPAMVRALKGSVSTENCLKQLSGYFLIRNDHAPGFRCVPKSAAGTSLGRAGR